MTNVSYQTIIKKAKDLKKGVEKNKKLEVIPRWSYYFKMQSFTKLNKRLKRTLIAYNFGNAIKPMRGILL